MIEDIWYFKNLTITFDWITRIYPGSQSTQDGRCILDPVLEKKARHTGA